MATGIPVSSGRIAENMHASSLSDVSHVTAVVTGGETGISLLITQVLQSNGAKVYITGRREDVLQQTARQYSTGPGSVHPLPGDISSKAEAIRLAKELESKEPNGIQLLVNHPGIERDGDTEIYPVDTGNGLGKLDMKDAKSISEHFLEIEEEQWAETLRTNVSAQYFMSLAFLPLLAKGGSRTPGCSSHIINILGMAGALRGSRNWRVVYATSKAAFNNLSRQLATEFKGVGVRVNFVALGMFPGEMGAGTAGNSGDGKKSALDNKKPSGGPSESGETATDLDMAATILFLAGKGGLFYNGQTFYPDDRSFSCFLRLDNWAEMDDLRKGIKDEGKAYSASGDGKVPWVSKTDIAACACANILTEVTGRNIVHVNLTSEELAHHHVSLGIPEDYAKALAGLDILIKNGSEEQTNDVVLSVTGKKPKTFRAFAEENKSVWLLD